MPPDLLRDARTENRAKRLLETYLEPETGKPGHYSISGEEALFQLLEEGIPALLAMGEVYQTDAFRNLQAAPPKISVGVSVHGSVLDLEVDTGAFPVEELRELLQSLHQKKRYHRLRDGSLLRLDDSLEGLDELNDTLELSGVIAALSALKEPCHVLLTTDSKYVVDSVTKGWVYGWQKRGWVKSDKKPALNVDLWKQLLPLLEKHQVTFHWVKGHAGHPENERCDQLAVMQRDRNA